MRWFLLLLLLHYLYIYIFFIYKFAYVNKFESSNGLCSLKFEYNNIRPIPLLQLHDHKHCMGIGNEGGVVVIRQLKEQKKERPIYIFLLNMKINMKPSNHPFYDCMLSGHTQRGLSRLLFIIGPKSMGFLWIEISN